MEEKKSDVTGKQTINDMFYYGYYLLTVKSRFMFMIINSRLEVN